MNEIGSFTGINIANSRNNRLTALDITNSKSTAVVFQGFNFNNSLTNSFIKNTTSTSYGLTVSGANNTFYNNFFNNTMNAYVSAPIPGNNTWNTSYIFAENATNVTGMTNIIGGSYFGGNFWAAPNGSGFSQVCVDSSIPYGICDSPYGLDANNVDFLPLTISVAPVCSGFNPTLILNNPPSGSVINSSDALLNVTMTNTNETANITFYKLRYCYQETANESTACGGLGTGTYALGELWNWTDPEQLYDGDWNTRGVAPLTFFPDNVSILYVNYTKPNTATNNSLWTASTALGYYNISVASCYNSYDDKLVLRLTSYNRAFSSVNDYVYFHCYNGTEWIFIFNNTTGSISL